MVDDRIAAPPEQRRKITLRLRVDRDAKNDLSLAARLLNRAPRILNPVAALIMVSVIGLAVGDD